MHSPELRKKEKEIGKQIGKQRPGRALAGGWTEGGGEKGKERKKEGKGRVSCINLQVMPRASGSFSTNRAPGRRKKQTNREIQFIFRLFRLLFFFLLFFSTRKIALFGKEFARSVAF